MKRNRLALDVSIVIITHNRSNFLRRFAGALENMNFGGHFIVAESSDPEHFKKSEQYVSELGLGYKLIHLHIPKQAGDSISQSMNDCFKAGISKIETKYAMLSCDDDIPVPETLQKCSVFLDNHPEYNGANGELAWYDIDGPASRWLRGKRKIILNIAAKFFNVVNIQGQRFGINDAFSIEGETAVDRLIEFLENPFHTMFAVVRKDTLNYIVPPNSKKMHFPHFIADYSWLISIALAGKIHHFKEPQVIRQYHGKNLSIKDENHPFPTFLESMFKGYWGDDSRLFVENIANQLMLRDKIDEKVAMKYAVEGYRIHCILRLGGNIKKKEHKETNKRYFYMYCLPWTLQSKRYVEAISCITRVAL